jgi:Raf kinase inhibitor-like YbhB/YbcL family protein
MKFLSLFFSICLVCLLLWMLLPFRAQSQKADQVRIEGHVYETTRLEPTGERIRQLKLPAGFRITRFAELSNPRMIAVAADGTVYLTQREPGTLVMLRDGDNDGVAEIQKVVAERKMLHGVTIHHNKIYLATVKEVYTADLKPDGALGELQAIIDDLPDGGQHPNRTLAVGPDDMLYISVGSTCNACRETNEEHATLLRVNLQNHERAIFAGGLRNTIGFGWHPGSNRLYGMDHGIDWLGDNEQEEELNELTEGARYGWPYVYTTGKFVAHPNPPKEFTREMWARMSKQPSLLYTPHSAPMQMAFYTGGQFPNDYLNNAFVAMRGSWNRQPPSGYEVIRIRFDQSGKAERIEQFITGFLVKGGAPGNKDGHFARLAGVAMAKDGALLISDDDNGVIYRVSYEAGDRKPPVNAAQERDSFPRVITSSLPGMKGKSRLTVTSQAFGNGKSIPQEYSAYGSDVSPPLNWSGVPREAKSVVVLVEDPDAMSPKPFVHWMVVNLPPNVTGLPMRLEKTELLAQFAGAVHGANHLSQVGYFGPKPPAGDPPHHYHFQVFALDTKLQLPSGANRQALLAALQGHVLAFGELVGTYQRQADPVATSRK